MRYTRSEFLKRSLLAGGGMILAPILSSVQRVQASQYIVPGGPSFIRNGDARYDELALGFNKRIVRTPSVIARCETTEDVSAAVRFARERKLSIAIRSGGHNFEGYSSIDGGMQINLSSLDRATMIQDRRLRIGPGCKLSSLYDFLLPLGRIVPAGSCGSVGIGGLALGGGYGFFSREYGLTCDNLLEATIVDGSGNVRSTNDDAELLWALRGGGTGGLGVVTEMIFETHPAPSKFRSYHFKTRNLTAERASAALEEWFHVAERLPRNAFSAFVLNGRTLNVLTTSFTTSLGPSHFVSSESRRFANPISTARALRQYYGAKKPLYFKNASAGLYRDFSEIEPLDILKIVTCTPGMIFQMNTLGGNIANPDFEKASCFPHRAKNFLAELQTYWEQPSQGPYLMKRFEEVQTLVREHGTTAQYSNYCDESFPNWEASYYGDNYPRLRAVKRVYDPDNIFRHPQSIQV